MGDALATNYPRTGTDNVSNPSNPVTCKSGVYPYTYINQSDASTKSIEMYNSVYFESDLVNSYAWDTAIVFIQTFSGDTDYSRQIRLQTTIAKCGESHSGSTYDIKCNIYDMAGNTCELSTEAYLDTSNPCSYRGGSYLYTEVFTSSRITTNVGYCDVDGAFRSILYL